MHLLTTTLLSLALATSSVVHATSCSTHTYTACADGITHWYDPDDGMICDPLDCGGGRAPPKTNVPCCPSYTGTLTCDNSPSYLPCFNKNVASSTAMGSMGQPTSAAAAATTTTGNAGAQSSGAASQGGSSVFSLSGAPTIAGVGTTISIPVIYPSSVVSSATTTSSSSSKPVATGNGASGLRFSPLVEGVVGAVVLMV